MAAPQGFKEKSDVHFRKLTPVSTYKIEREVGREE